MALHAVIILCLVVKTYAEKQYSDEVLSFGTRGSGYHASSCMSRYNKL